MSEDIIFSYLFFKTLFDIKPPPNYHIHLYNVTRTVHPDLCQKKEESYIRIVDCDIIYLIIKKSLNSVGQRLHPHQHNK